MSERSEASPVGWAGRGVAWHRDRHQVRSENSGRPVTHRPSTCMLPARSHTLHDVRMESMDSWSGDTTTAM